MGLHPIFREIDSHLGITASLEKINREVLEGRGRLKVIPPYEVGANISWLESEELNEGRFIPSKPDQVVTLHVCLRSDLAKYNENPVRVEELQVSDSLKFGQEEVSMRAELELG